MQGVATLPATHKRPWKCFVFKLDGCFEDSMKVGCNFAIWTRYVDGSTLSGPYTEKIFIKEGRRWIAIAEGWG